uniref:LIM zinc-binding domain-containing protein n=1 Tax=Panagrolaimus sp. JU765 TaxID=591449 RepID=A0AC34QJE6_9BILA
MTDKIESGHSFQRLVFHSFVDNNHPTMIFVIFKFGSRSLNESFVASSTVFFASSPFALVCRYQTIMATVPPAPPPPPPPNPGQRYRQNLDGSGRTSADRERVGGLRSAGNSQHGSVPQKIHPQELQHAARNLRKTQYREPLLASEPEQLLERSAELPVGGYWPSRPEHDRLELDQTRTPIPPPSNGAHAFVPYNEPNQYSYSLNQAFNSGTPRPTFGSSATSRWMPPPSAQKMFSHNNNSPFNKVPSNYSSTTTKSYFSSASNFNGSGSSRDDEIPDYPPPPPPSSSTSGTYSASLITNPQDYIHAFATQTSAEIMDSPSEPAIRQTLPQPKPKNFAEQLRDATLTDRQKYANQFQKSNLPERLPPQTVAHIYEQSTADTQRQLAERRPPSSSTDSATVDELIRDMEWKLNTGSVDICVKCQKEIVQDTPGVTALGKAYHVSCFLCDQCQKQLAGCSFYNVDGKNLCQVDYMNSLDKCEKCGTPITQKILRAMGKAFHPECFSCSACTKSLDGTPFTVDPSGAPYCLDCFHERFSPRCAVCLKAIVPSAGETEVSRIVAMDRSYHVACYKCEDCGLQLNSKIEGQGCYPLESHLFCKNCNLKRLKAIR